MCSSLVITSSLVTPSLSHSHIPVLCFISNPFGWTDPIMAAIRAPSRPAAAAPTPQPQPQPQYQPVGYPTTAPTPVGYPATAPAPVGYPAAAAAAPAAYTASAAAAAASTPTTATATATTAVAAADLDFMKQPGWKLTAWMNKAGPQPTNPTWTRRWFVLADGQASVFYFVNAVRGVLLLFVVVALFLNTLCSSSCSCPFHSFNCRVLFFIAHAQNDPAPKGASRLPI